MRLLRSSHLFTKKHTSTKPLRSEQNSSLLKNNNIQPLTGSLNGAPGVYESCSVTYCNKTQMMSRIVCDVADVEQRTTRVCRPYRQRNFHQDDATVSRNQLNKNPVHLPVFIENDPDMLLAAVSAGTMVLKKQRKLKQKSNFIKKIFNVSVGESKSGYSSLPNESTSMPIETNEYDLINNCPLIKNLKKSNGRRLAMSERHMYDRLLVLETCRRFLRLKHADGVF